MDEFRQVSRQIFSGLFKWTTEFDLVNAGVEKVLQSVKEAMNKLADKRVLVTCNAGRTRSPTVVAFLLLQLHVGKLLVSRDEAELKEMYEDKGLKVLQGIYEKLDNALQCRKLGPEFRFVDRDGRFMKVK